MIKTNLRMTFACWVVLVINIIFLVAVSFTSAKELTTATIFLDFNDTQLIYNPDGTTVINTTGTILSMGNEWETKQFKPNIYHMRHKEWKDFYWKVDTNLKRIYKVTAGSFGSHGGADMPMKGISARVEQFGNRLSPGYIILQFSSSYLAYEPMTGILSIAANGAILSSCKDWEAKQVWTNLYHIRKKTWNNMYWEINTAEPMVTNAVKNGRYGSLGGEKSALKASMRTVGLKPANEQLNIVTEDMGMRSVKESDYPKSEWIESEKTLYRELLKHGNFDVLVVPFQVQGYAVDHTERSLMTRYLIHRLENTTNTKLPNPTFVARALGERMRRFSEDEVYKLANDLKVNTLIRGYVGHNRDMKMNITIIVQQAAGTAGFGPHSKPTLFKWDKSFSDTHLPSEVFSEILDEVISKLPIPQTKKYEVVEHKKLDNLALPDSFISVVNNIPNSPLISAYYLQLIGMLHPNTIQHYTAYAIETMRREQFFERSLVLLNEISTDSPDYALLKARALFYLHRRPAALSVLGIPKTDEEKALFALLNGNLPELEKSTEKIKSPLLKLFAEIEANDIRWNYTKTFRDSSFYKKIANGFPGWEILITRRFFSNDLWNQPSNIAIKQLLDKDYPIEGYTAEDIIRGNALLGKSPFEGDEVDFSTLNHYRRLLKKDGQRFCCMKNSVYLTEMDYLDLLKEIGEFHLFNNVRLELFLRGLPESAIEMIIRYEMAYMDHLDLTYLKIEALKQISGKKQGAIRENLQKNIEKYERNACHWLQGQTAISHYLCFPDYTFYYQGDFPPLSPAGVSDRMFIKDYLPFDSDSLSKNVNVKDDLMRHELNLLYTHDYFYYLQIYYEKLLNHGMQDAAKKLLEKNQHRFIGHPDRPNFMARNIERASDAKNKADLYEEAITQNPDTWKPYFELAKLYIKEGDFKKASETFQRYPFFNDDRNSDRVDLSNCAFKAGFEFYYVGAAKEATPFFELSASYETGSQSEMFSRTLLSFSKGDYKEATYHALNMAKRYNDTKHYIMLLYIMGYHKDAWLLFDNAFNPKSISSNIWRAALVGHRMEGKTDEEIRKWLDEERMHDIAPAYTGEYLLLSHMIDRVPNPKLAELLEEKSLSFKSTGKTVSVKRPFGFHLAWFADGYHAIRNGEFLKAFEGFKQRMAGVKDTYQLYRYAIPYIAWSAVKSGNQSWMESHLDNYRKEFGEDFYFHLSKAFIYGGKGNHDQAIQHIKSAHYNVNVIDSQYIPTWYELVETAERLYSDTGYIEYRNLALEWARIYQDIFPMFSWAYAVEAKYTESDKDRLRALALTLYLDKQSERISHFSEADRKKALEWLEKNNPFRKEIKGSQGAHGI